MKKLLAGFVIAALAACVGCDKSTTGGPGVSKSNSGHNIISQADETFKLDVPNLSTSIKQGEMKKVKIGITRGKNFGEDVHLKFDNVPKGVTLEPASPTIKASDKEQEITIKAGDDAAIGDYDIKVEGHPTKGATGTSQFKLKVDKK